MGFLSSTETAVTTAFAATANTFGANLLGVFRPAFVIGFTIWITLIAYEVAFGKSEEGFLYLFTKIGKIFLIGVLALYGWPEVSELFGGIKDGFVGGGSMSGTLESKLIEPITSLWASLFTWPPFLDHCLVPPFVLNVCRALCCRFALRCHSSGDVSRRELRFCSAVGYRPLLPVVSCVSVHPAVF